MRLMILSQNKKKLIEVNKLDLRVRKDGGEYLIVIPASAEQKEEILGHFKDEQTAKDTMMHILNAISSIQSKTTQYFGTTFYPIEYEFATVMIPEVE